MRIASGATRRVILVGPVAIKFARITNPFHALSRLLHFASRGEVGVQLTRYHPSLGLAVVKYLFAGITANLSEARVWREHHDRRLVPTQLSIFGILNVQDRGVPVGEAELKLRNPFCREILEMTAEARFDFERAVNFCSIGNEVLLADYGNREARELFPPPTSVRTFGVTTTLAS
jgi:hypothetical protein